MKKAPLVVKIPCVLDMVVSGLLVTAVLVFLGSGKSPSMAELILLVILSINGVAAYKCMKGDARARYVLAGLKILLFLFMPLALLIGLLWGYLLVWHRSSREFFLTTG